MFSQVPGARGRLFRARQVRCSQTAQLHLLRPRSSSTLARPAARPASRPRVQSPHSRAGTGIQIRSFSGKDSASRVSWPWIAIPSAALLGYLWYQNNVKLGNLHAVPDTARAAALRRGATEPEDSGDDDPPFLWEDYKAIAANVSENCWHELVNSMAACQLIPYDPSKACVQHLVSGLEQVGDVPDPIWDKIIHAVVTRILATLYARGDWVAMCDVVENFSNHVESRAAATLAAMDKSESIAEDVQALRVSRNLFLRAAIGIKADLWTLLNEQMMISIAHKIEPVPNPVDARTRARVEDIYLQAAHLMLQHLPHDAREHAEHPERVNAFLSCSLRAGIFYEAARIMSRRHDFVAETFYLMQSMNQIPPNTATYSYEAAMASSMISSALHKAIFRDGTRGKRPQHAVTRLQCPSAKDLRYLNLEQLRSLSKDELAESSLLWSCDAVLLATQARHSHGLPQEQQAADLTLVTGPLAVPGPVPSESTWAAYGVQAQSQQRFPAHEQPNSSLTFPGSISNID